MGVGHCPSASSFFPRGASWQCLAGHVKLVCTGWSARPLVQHAAFLLCMSAGSLLCMSAGSELEPQYSRSQSAASAGVQSSASHTSGNSFACSRLGGPPAGGGVPAFLTGSLAQVQSLYLRCFAVLTDVPLLVALMIGLGRPCLLHACCVPHVTGGNQPVTSQSAF